MAYVNILLANIWYGILFYKDDDDDENDSDGAQSEEERRDENIKIKNKKSAQLSLGISDKIQKNKNPK